MNILVTGSGGQLGHALRRASAASADRYFFTDVAGDDTLRLDITDREAVERFVREHAIGAVVNCAAYTDVERAEEGIDPANAIYMGDDIPDLECMREVGIPVCPADAAAEVIEASRYVSEFRGGEGAVRDIVEQVLRARGDWARDSMGVTPSSLVASR